MELGIEIIDLRTKQNVLDYMENYEVEVPMIEKEDDYVPCSETGLSNKEITDELNISEGTVRNYISNILSKLDLKNRTQLAILAVQTGISVDFSSYTD